MGKRRLRPPEMNSPHFQFFPRNSYSLLYLHPFYVKEAFKMFISSFLLIPQNVPTLLSHLAHTYIFILTLHLWSFQVLQKVTKASTIFFTLSPFLNANLLSCGSSCSLEDFKSTNQLYLNILFSVDLILRKQSSILPIIILLDSDFCILSDKHFPLTLSILFLYQLLHLNFYLFPFWW